MGERVPCEFALIRYVPDPVKGEFANIGVVLRAVGAGKAGSAGSNTGTVVRFTRDWGRVRCLDPDADTEMLESLEVEIAERMASGVQHRVNAKPMLETLEDSLSNCLQITAMQGTLAESLPAEMEQLLRMYVEPLRVTGGRRKVSGRVAIATRMRDEFTRAGVWGLMRKRVAASQYTRVGDPLKLDCGYRNGMVKLFHAVSLENDTEVAKSLAYSVGEMRDGVARVEGLDLELTAFVETISGVSDPEQYGFGVGVMEKAGLRVLTVADLGRVAETARRDLHV